LLSETKQFTSNVLKLSQRQRLLFLEEIVFWDGNYSNDYRNARTYCNTDKTSVDWVQTVAHLSGQQGLIRLNTGISGFKSTKKCYTVRLNNREYASAECLKLSETTAYSGRVHCFTTSTGNFLVRYKDSIHVTGNSNYLEGFKLLDEWQLETKQVDTQIKSGALKVFDNWTYDGKRVAFTGANLAEALFGSKTYDNRKKALDIQFGVYFKRFPILLDFARRITAECETGVVRLPSGQYLELLDAPKDNAKAGAAFKGQGGGAAFMQSKMLVAAERYPDHPLMAQIHDDLMWDDIPAAWSKRQIKEFVHHLGAEEVDMFPGLIVPFKTKIGPNWGEVTELK
jgi:hypothetical protein